MTTSLISTTRTKLAVGLVAAAAAFCVAAPAHAELVGGVTNGGCLQGIQVGHAHNPDGSITPICQIFR